MITSSPAPPPFSATSSPVLSAHLPGSPDSPGSSEELLAAGDYEAFARDPACSALFPSLTRTQHLALLEELLDQGTCLAYRRLLQLQACRPEIPVAWESFAWAVAQSGDTSVLEYWEPETTVEHIETLLSSPHRAIIDACFDYLTEDTLPDYFGERTPVLLEVCAERGVALAEVVREASSALEGERLAALFCNTIEHGYYPPLDHAVQATADTVRALLAYDPDPSEDTLVEAFHLVADDEVAQVLRDAFPDTECFLEELINTMEQRLPSLVTRVTPALLQELLAGDYPLWDSYEEDLVWLLETLEKYGLLAGLQFQLTPTVVCVLAREASPALLRSLVANYPLVAEGRG